MPLESPDQQHWKAAVGYGSGHHRSRLELGGNHRVVRSIKSENKKMAAVLPAAIRRYHLPIMKNHIR